MKRLYVRTFGCQMNVYDSGKLKALLASDGFEQTEQMGDADLVIVNTCSIRDKPEQKLHSFLGEALATKRKADRKVTVAVAGCVAQQEGQKLLDRYPQLDLQGGGEQMGGEQQTRARQRLRRCLGQTSLSNGSPFDAYKRGTDERNGQEE